MKINVYIHKQSALQEQESAHKRPVRSDVERCSFWKVYFWEEHSSTYCQDTVGITEADVLTESCRKMLQQPERDERGTAC